MAKVVGFGLWLMLVLSISNPVLAVPLSRDSDEVDFLNLPLSTLPTPGGGATEESLTTQEILPTKQMAVTHPPILVSIQSIEDSLKAILYNLLTTVTNQNRANVEALIPELEAVLEKMTTLLAEDSETIEDFRHQKLLLDKELEGIEALIFKKQGKRSASAKTQENYRKQLQGMHDAFDKVRSDYSSLTSTPTLDEPEVEPARANVSYLGQSFDLDMNTTEEELFEYLTPQPHMAQVPLFQLPNGTQSPQELMAFVRGVTDPQQRLLAYGYAVEIINQDQNPAPILLQILADIYKTPALVTLQAEISSEALRNIFSTTPKKLYNRQHSRVLTMDGSRVATGDSSSTYRAWNFQQVGDTEYFLIVNTLVSVAVGLEPESSAPPNAKSQRIGTSSLASARSNERYHWKIAYLAEPNVLTFLNRHLDLTLDGNEYGHIYPHVSNNNGYQQWRLVL